MRITKFKTQKDENGLAYLVKEQATNYQCDNLPNPASIAIMLTSVFHLDQETEEYLYLLCFNTKMKLLGVFEVSHGTVNASLASPRVIFQKALLCNASNIVIAHNHPSDDVCPSRKDVAVTESLKRAGELMELPLIDSLIIGSREYYSFSANKKSKIEK